MNLKHTKILRILTILLALSLAIVSIAGAFFPETYARDSASLGAQGVGQDLVDLFVGVPLLLLSFYYTTRGNRVFALVYGGTLFYIMYSFIIYCFGVNFNQFFLFYCLTLSLSLYSFILLFSDLMGQQVEGWFEKAPVRMVSVYLFVVVLIFYALWLKSIVPAIIHNEVPKDVSDYNLLLTLALAAMVLVLVVRGISADYTVAIVFGVLSVISIIFSLLLFRKMKRVTSI